MPRSVGSAVQQSFLKGLITEASGMNFPEDACTDTWDCVHNINGTIETRPGLNFEPNYGTKQIDRDGVVVSSYTWKNVAGNGDKVLFVVQVGDTLYFWDASEPTIPISNTPLSQTIDLNDFSPEDAPSPETVECQFAAGQGYLFVTHPYLESFYLTYSLDDTSLTATQIDLEIRDTAGLDDGFDVDERPDTGLGGLTLDHKYNLYNQGWNTDNLTAWDAARDDMPSNADVMWVLKDASDNFDPTLVDKLYRGNSPAPRGHFILNLYNQDRATASGVNVPTVSTGFNRCATVAFFQGRTFFAGLNTQEHNSKIFFSQIIERPDQFGKCYQANDLTSDSVFDLLPNDGGWIDIQEAGTILKLFVTPSGLIVFATNGVWMITGSTGLGFTATDFNVPRISSIGAITNTSFVDAGGQPIWWNLDGIYTLLPTQSGGLQIQSLTVSTIQSFYDDIPVASKRYARGSYNPVTGIIQWHYRSTDTDDITETYTPDRILNLNTRTQAFYPWTTSNDRVTIHASHVLEQVGGGVTVAEVIDDASETVVDDAGETVIAYTFSDAVVAPRTKYLTSYIDDASRVQFTISEAWDEENYVDWISLDNVGIVYDAYFVSGYKTHGDLLRRFQPEYVSIMSVNDAETGYLFQTRWDFATSSDTGRWSNPQSVTNDGADYAYRTRRLKVRGRGLTLQYKISRLDTLPFKLAGWTGRETINQDV